MLAFKYAPTSSESAMSNALRLGYGSAHTPGIVISSWQTGPDDGDDVPFYDAVKRVFDIFLAIVLLIGSAPIMLLAAVAVRLSSEGPVIFVQKRLTQGGRVFTMYKLRTMKTSAEVGSGAVWAASSDPRVTPVGAFLRRSRIDELPQLWNVIIGDMSIIGPRPERPEIATELDQMIPGFCRRLQVRAGLTGLAQTSSGYAACVSSSRRKLRLDMLYIRNRCLLLDMRIIFRTVGVVLTGFGAR